MLEKALSKGNLETIIQNSIKENGFFKTAILLETLKSLGFYYATTSGLSINIEDLKSPIGKDNILSNINLDLKKISYLWNKGYVSQIERFKKIMDNWTIASEILKTEILSSYNQYNLTNNLYIMASSGARGNISQVRQVIGIRGLMSDQEGNIIDVPIAKNFREGLTSMDYFISSYGARKGIVDTALKTADAGYLTRRLIYVAQDLIIREQNCMDKLGLTSILEKNSTANSFIGQHILSYYNKNRVKKIIFTNDQILDEKLFINIKNNIEKDQFLYLNLRSALTCNLYNSVCQFCYGWDLAKKDLVALGTTIGIIAAQSIGEPGTQLTMRTFHTGGVYTGTVEGDIKSKISGKIANLNNLKWTYARTKYGHIAKKLQKQANIKIIDFKNNVSLISLNQGTLMYSNFKKYLIKNQSIAEYLIDPSINNKKKFREIYPNIQGEILSNIRIKENKTKTQYLNNDSRISIGSNNLFLFPKNIKYLNSFTLNPKKAIAVLKIVSPTFGVPKITDNNILIYNFLEKLKTNEGTNILAYSKKFKCKPSISSFKALFGEIYTWTKTNLDSDFTLDILTLDLQSFEKNFVGYTIKFVPLVKSYQWIYPFTTIANVYIIPNISENSIIYNIKKNKLKNDFLINTNKNSTSIYENFVNYFCKVNKKIISYNNIDLYNLRKDGLNKISQNLEHILLNKGSFINNTYNKFAFPNSVLGITVSYKKKANDIVQGLPKVENIIEARDYSNFAILAESPSIFLGKNNHSLIKTSYKNFFTKIKYKGKKSKKIEHKKSAQNINIAYNIFRSKNLCLYKNKLYTYSYYKTISDQLKNKFKKTPIFKVFNKNSIWLNAINEHKIKNSTNLFIDTDLNISLELKPVTGISTTNLKTYHKLIKKPGDFLDICEPLTTGILSPKEFLRILYNYYFSLFGNQEGYIKALNKFQIVAINSIYAIYKSQGVDIALKHIEIIIKQLTSKANILKQGDSPLIINEKIHNNLAKHIFDTLKYFTPNNIQYSPSFIPASKYSLNKEGFLTNAGFQETKQVLMKSSLYGSKDWLKTLKAPIIAGKVSQMGTNALNYIHYLDFIYKYKNYNTLKEIKDIKS